MQGQWHVGTGWQGGLSRPHGANGSLPGLPALGSQDGDGGLDSGTERMPSVGEVGAAEASRADVSAQRPFSGAGRPAARPLLRGLRPACASPQSRPHGPQPLCSEGFPRQGGKPAGPFPRVWRTEPGSGHVAAAASAYGAGPSALTPGLRWPLSSRGGFWEGSPLTERSVL